MHHTWSCCSCCMSSSRWSRAKRCFRSFSLASRSFSSNNCCIAGATGAPPLPSNSPAPPPPLLVPRPPPQSCACAWTWEERTLTARSSRSSFEEDPAPAPAPADADAPADAAPPPKLSERLPPPPPVAPRPGERAEEEEDGRCGDIRSPIVRCEHLHVHLLDTGHVVSQRTPTEAVQERRIVQSRRTTHRSCPGFHGRGRGGRHMCASLLLQERNVVVEINLPRGICLCIGNIRGGSWTKTHIDRTGCSRAHRRTDTNASDLQTRRSFRCCCARWTPLVARRRSAATSAAMAPIAAAADLSGWWTARRRASAASTAKPRRSAPQPRAFRRLVARVGSLPLHSTAAL